MVCMTSAGIAVEAASVRKATAHKLTPAEVREARGVLARALVRGLAFTQGQARQVLGVGRSKLARLLGDGPTKPPRPARRRSLLTPVEGEAMLHDHDRDPYATTEDREAVRAYVASHLPRDPKPGGPVPIRPSQF